MNDVTHSALLKASVKGMPRFAFRTLDGLLALDECPDIEDGAWVIMRWMPLAGTTVTRRYERTSETWMGLPVYRETP